MPTAVEVVELAFGDGIVDVDGGEKQQAHLGHLVQAVHTGGGFFRDAPDGFGFAGEVGGIHIEDRIQQLQHDLVLVVVGGVGGGHFAFLLELGTFVDQQRRVTAVVQNEVRLIVAPMQGLGTLVSHIQRCRRRRHDLGWKKCCRRPSGLRRPTRSMFQ